MESKKVIKSDVLIIGTGIAGGTVALGLAERGIQVCLITCSSDIKESNTRYAQGGIIYKGRGDSQLLEKDILSSGGRICNKKAIKILAREGPLAVEDILIQKLGINFSKNEEGNLHLTKEAGHSCRRIIHVKDQTGKSIEEAFIKKLKKNPNIQIYTNHTLIDLLTLPYHLNRSEIADYSEFSIPKETDCVGAYILDNKARRVKSFIAKKTILATGGVGQLFLRTCNSKVSRGDGLVTAARAGAKITNAEFIQFHPTSFYHHKLSNFLITEAMRGEGAQLKNQKGELFMNKYDKRGSLAPRDIVTRGIFEEMLKTGDEYVLLDVFSYMPRQKIKKYFPKIYRICLRHGIDITKEPIPITPTAHYFCGGIKVDEFGRTNINNLYAIGEVSCTGLHGANRLASTSLLECLVWARKCAQNVLSSIKKSKIINPAIILSWKYTHRIKKIDPVLIQQDWLLIKSIMWNYVGIIRTKKRLQRAVDDLNHLEKEINLFYRNVFISDELIGLRNGVKAALLIAKSALSNRHSIGSHFIKKDYF